MTLKTSCPGVESAFAPLPPKNEEAPPVETEGLFRRTKCRLIRKHSSKTSPRRSPSGSFPLSTQIGVFDFFLAFATSKNPFEKIQGNTPLIIFLIFQNLHFIFLQRCVATCYGHSFSENFAFKKFCSSKNASTEQTRPKIRISESSDAKSCAQQLRRCQF